MRRGHYGIGEEEVGRMLPKELLGNDVTVVAAWVILVYAIVWCILLLVDVVRSRRGRPLP
jgi:ABC-type dipeptide/oligopeptide/nickel transport system permease component